MRKLQHNYLPYGLTDISAGLMRMPVDKVARFSRSHSDLSHSDYFWWNHGSRMRSSTRIGGATNTTTRVLSRPTQRNRIGSRVPETGQPDLWLGPATSLATRACDAGLRQVPRHGLATCPRLWKTTLPSCEPLPCSLSSDLVPWKLTFQRSFLSGGVLFSQTLYLAAHEAIPDSLCLLLFNRNPKNSPRSSPPIYTWFIFNLAHF